MLKSIVIDNYKTFIKETTIDFSASKYSFLSEENIGSGNILKGAIFVGENASGKTNILRAIRLLIDVLFSLDTPKYYTMKSFYTKKSSFSISYEFVIDQKTVTYVMRFNEFGFIAETLRVNDDEVLTRNGGDVVYRHDKKNFYSSVPNTLSAVRQIYFGTHFYNNTTLNTWIDFVRKSVYVNCYKRTIETSSEYQDYLDLKTFIKKDGIAKINQLFKKINYRQKVNNVLRTKNEAGNYNMESSEKMVVFEKDGTKTEIPMTMESTGNITFLALIPIFIHAIENNCMLILDEFSSGFHNELESCLMKYFYHYSKDSQLFLVTHSTSVLNNAIIRPDQVYSARFNGMDGTVLSRFSDRDPMPRESQNLEQMYLNGEFNGMPYYTKAFGD